VVESEDIVEKHEACVGQVQIVNGYRWEGFDLPDDIIGEEPDCACGEGWEAGKPGWGVAGESILEKLEDIGLNNGPPLASVDLESATAGNHSLVRANADKRIPANLFATLD
jgi:hypothetical protein